MAKQRIPGTVDPDSEEVRAFRAAVRDVKPLPQVPAAPGLVKPRVRARRRPVAREPTSLDVSMPLIATPGDAALAAGDTVTFQRPGVRTQVVRRLRRGLIPTEAELDLHGLTQSHARDRLADFLASSRDAGRRCVRIVHGKGYRSGARGPVLKVAVDLWLRRHHDVMAFTSAKLIDGGTGAVYVLLRA